MEERQVVVITGASAGVGRATVREFAKRHSAVALIARGRDGLEAAKREVEQLGRTALVLPMDVADPDAMEAAADRTERALGPIDVWINNAMASQARSGNDHPGRIGTRVPQHPVASRVLRGQARGQGLHRSISGAHRLRRAANCRTREAHSARQPLEPHTGRRRGTWSIR